MSKRRPAAKPTARELLTERYADQELIFWDDLDDAIIGVVQRCASELTVCYDYEKAVACFVAGGMTDEEAIEWIEFNVLGAYVGELTPFFLHRPESL